MVSYVLFFQAEDGIRYLVRSRGLGDVYKRQHHRLPVLGRDQGSDLVRALCEPPADVVQRCSPDAVSYTHLTLPTSDLV